MQHETENMDQTAIARGNRNLRRVLLWLFMWGWTTESRLQELLGVVRRPGPDLVKRRILVKVESPRGHPVTYSISQFKASAALEVYEEETGRNAIPYPWPRTSVPFAQLGEHNDIAQQIALIRLQDPSAALTTGRELQHGGKGAVPDFQIMHGIMKEWHEIELTAKYNEALFFQLYERDQARNADKFTRLIFWCRTPGIARNLKDALDRQRIPHVVRRGDGKLVRVPNVEGWDPRGLKSATTILLIRNRVEQKVAAQPAGPVVAPIGHRDDFAGIFDDL